MSANNIFYVTSHLSEGISQATGILRDYVLSFWPSGYFRSIICNNADVSVQQDYEATNVAMGKYIRKLPAFSIKTTMNMDGTVAENPVHDAWMDLYRRNGHLNDFTTSYHMLYRDHENDHFIGTLPKRYHLNFDLALRVESEPQMWDTLAYIKHSIAPEIFFYINDWLTAPFPNHVLRLLALQYGLDMTVDTDRFALLELLQKHCAQRVDMVTNPQTGESVFTHTYGQNILVKFNQATGDVQRKNLSVTFADIKMTAIMQLVLCTNYGVTLSGNPAEYGELLPALEGTMDEPPSFHLTVNRYQPKEQLPDGRQLIFSKGFVSDQPEIYGAREPIYDQPTFIAPLSDATAYTELPDSTADFPLWVPQGLTLKTQGAVSAIYNDERAGWQILLHEPDSAVIVLAESVFLGRRGKSYVVELAAQTNRAGVGIEINTVEQRSAYRLTEQGYSQKIAAELYVRNKKNRLVLKWKNAPYDPVVHTTPLDLTFRSIRVLPLLSVIQSTKTTDILYLGSILGEEMLAVWSYLLENKIDPATVFTFLISQKDKKHLEPHEFTVDWEQRTITLLNPLFNYTHYLSLYADRQQYNDVLYRHLYKTDVLGASYHNLSRSHPLS